MGVRLIFGPEWRGTHGSFPSHPFNRCPIMADPELTLLTCLNLTEDSTSNQNILKCKT